MAGVETSKWDTQTFKCEPKLAKDFEDMVGLKNKSLVLRELVRLFVDGKVKVSVVKTFGR